jgi:hypothetical protein
VRSHTWRAAIAQDGFIDVRLDYPGRHRPRRLLRRVLSTAAGALLLLVAGLAMLALLPAALFTYGVLAGAPREDLPVSDGEIILATCALIAIAVITRRAGLWLLRGNRELVLFLRRFGYRDATSVASFAATKTIGRSWRLVTLDDAAVTPVGVAGGVSGLLRTGERVQATSSTVFRILARIVRVVWWSSAAILVLAYLQSGSLAPYEDILTDVGSGHVPAELGEATLTGAVAVAAVTLALLLVAFGACALVGLAGMVLTPLFVAGSVVAGAARTAEGLKERQVSSAGEIDVVARDLDAASKRVFAPRLVVLRVASEIWQPTVRQLAFVSTLTIIDVSEPTENLLWEVQELADRLGPRCVFVGHQDRIAELADRAADAAPLTPLAERLLVFLEEREVLVYRTDPAAVRQFARALQGKLLEVAALCPPTSAPELRMGGGQLYSEAGLARLEEELAGLDGVLARDGGAPGPAQRDRVCRALTHKAAALAALGRHDEQLAVYDEIVARYADAPEPALRERAAAARAEKAGALAGLERRASRREGDAP